MTKIVKSVFTEASAEKIYDYLIEPMNLVEYWPNVTEYHSARSNHFGHRGN